VSRRVARRRRWRKQQRVSKVDRRSAQRRVQATLRTEIGRVVQAVVERALAAEVTALLGREPYERRRRAPPERTVGRCGRCQQGWTTRLWRAGSYARTLLTVPASVQVRVPRVGCICGGTVRIEFALLAPYERSWGDVQAWARELSGLCLSLSDTREVVAQVSGRSVARSTLNGWVHQVAEPAEAVRGGPLSRVPPVVMLDGVWVTVLEPTGETKADAHGRRRPTKRRRKVVLLVAYGVDPTSGEHWVLDWEWAPAEDEASWRRLLERLHQRGLRTDAGLTLLVHDGSSGLDAALDTVHLGPGLLRQRCVFHVLRNIRDAVRGEPGMDRAGRRARRRAVLADAAAIWTATDRAEAQRRRQTFRTTWQDREPEAVACLERSFGSTLGYLDALAWARERGERWQVRCLRATSLLERLNRAIRQKARQAGAFHSEQGLAAAFALVITHRQRLPDQSDGDFWSEVLETRLSPA
jgi:transposase-like protein